ncbi:MAG: TIGR03032 family protein [Spirulina sp. SIO3F2]|nr:TIGR03032 family protein [Spirulina sp. SIO3F2]
MTETPDPNAPLRSVHTTNFAPILNQLGISLAVSTYQAGKLIVLRADGEVINTHFRIFPKPMGLAADHEKLAIGSTLQVWELRNVPAVAAKVDPPGKHDACYMPRRNYITGDIDIHEMGYAGEELWFVNTRFSCLCTLEPTCTFVPRWRPPFITGYDLSDRCHLNGLAIVDGQPRYITALGETDTPAGWRKNKASGGILMDIPSNEFVTRGLSMPHSPRWYDGKLWVLESGKGSLATVDLETGTVTTVAVLPGFTRGLSFWNRLAFIGLSQVRETAVFSGLPVTQQTERNCGVWVVHIDTGEIIAFLKFEDAVQEIFAVEVLPGIRFPEVIDWNEELLGTSYVLPDEAIKEVVETKAPIDKDEQADFLFKSGNDRYAQGNLQDAEANYRRCLELKPDLMLARYNLGVILRERDEWGEAREQFEQVQVLEPENPKVLNNLAIVAQHQGETEAAVQWYEKAIALDPNFASAHFNFGMLLLNIGEYERGFRECEWRWQTEEFVPFDCPHPRWDGRDIRDQTILVHTEQGSGDAIQFIRFIPQLAERCKGVILVCIPELMPLFKTVPGITKLLPPGNLSLNDFQTFVPLMSLPYCLSTTLNSLPNTVPYLDTTTPETIYLPREGFKVGIVWGGSPTQKNDHNRSAKLKDFLPVLSTPQVQFYSLQVGDRAAELQDLPVNLTVKDLRPLIQDYGDTANLIKQLDLVITVDTSVAHLAGAMGRR